jgi:hypothetical protein
MKLNTLTVELPGIDVLEHPLREAYSDISMAVTHSDITRLYLIEKYYGRTNSDAAGVVFIESLGEIQFKVQIWVLGGRTGLIGLDYGAEKHFLKEINDIVKKYATRIVFDESQEST